MKHFQAEIREKRRYNKLQLLDLNLSLGLCLTMVAHFLSQNKLFVSLSHAFHRTDGQPCYDAASIKISWKNERRRTNLIPAMDGWGPQGRRVTGCQAGNGGFLKDKRPVVAGGREKMGK